MVEAVFRRLTNSMGSTISPTSTITSGPSSAQTTTVKLDFPELWKVYSAAVKWFAKAFPLPQPQPAYLPSHEEIFVPRCESDDRTLSIDHVDYCRLDAPLMRRIQAEFLGRFPLWRIHLVGWDGETGVIIYPTAIRFGNQPVDTDPEEALRELAPRGLALRETWLARALKSCF